MNSDFDIGLSRFYSDGRSPTLIRLHPILGLGSLFDRNRHHLIPRPVNIGNCYFRCHIGLFRDYHLQNFTARLNSC